MWHAKHQRACFENITAPSQLFSVLLYMKVNPFVCKITAMFSLAVAVAEACKLCL
jgi:hypothetical protein